MATTSIRGTVKDRLLILLKAHAALTGKQVERVFPAQMEREVVYLGRTTGTNEPASIKTGRMRRDDTFTIDVWIGTRVDGDTAQEAEDRCEAMLVALEDVAANAAVTQPPLGAAGLQWCHLGDIDGPDIDPFSEGHDCWIRAELVCHARLT